jgi:hypothetical protein
MVSGKLRPQERFGVMESGRASLPALQFRKTRWTAWTEANSRMLVITPFFCTPFTSPCRAITATSPTFERMAASPDEYRTQITSESSVRSSHLDRSNSVGEITGMWMNG